MLLIDSTIYVDWLRRRVEPQEIIEPDAKKGVCAYYSRGSAEKARKAIK